MALLDKRPLHQEQVQQMVESGEKFRVVALEVDVPDFVECAAADNVGW
jgi:hypothetical protein